MTDAQTIVLYALTTLAQTCAALAALVGAIGLYRLQSLRVRRESLLRDISATLWHPTQTTEQLLIEARTRASRGHPSLSALLRDYEAAPSRIARSSKALAAFEGWNLLVIFGALVGFNHVPALAASPWTLRALWPVALGTVGVTAYCIVVWTEGRQGMTPSDEPPTYGITGQDMKMALTRAAEAWQFLAFVFAAFITVGFAFIDDIAECRWRRMLVRASVGGLITYFTLFSRRARNLLLLALSRWRVEKSS